VFLINIDMYQFAVCASGRDCYFNYLPVVIGVKDTNFMMYSVYAPERHGAPKNDKIDFC